MPKVNWEDLKKEYLLGNYKNLKEFAEAKGLKYNSDFRAKASGWKSDKLTTDRRKNDKIVRKTIEKVASKVSTDLAAATLKHLKISDKLLDEINKALSNSQELYKYVEKLRTGYGPGEFDEKIVCEVIDSINDAKLLNLVNSLEKLQRMQRQTLGILDEKDEQKIKLDERELDHKLSAGNSMENAIQESQQRIKSLADMINNPKPDRKKEDFENESNPEKSEDN